MRSGGGVSGVTQASITFSASKEKGRGMSYESGGGGKVWTAIRLWIDLF
jgi:hypothetical protein